MFGQDDKQELKECRAKAAALLERLDAVSQEGMTILDTLWQLRHRERILQKELRTVVSSIQRLADKVEN